MKTKAIVAGAVLAASTVASSAVLAEGPWSANIGVTSNYMWRGVTQTNDQSAIQGGIDYAHDSGFYAGTWMSNVSWTDPIGYELDLYAGFGFDTGPVSWDLGYIYYAYPLTSNDSTAGTADAGFGEAYLNFAWDWLGLGVAYTTNKAGKDPVTGSSFDTGDLYYFASADWEFKNGVGLGAVIGRYTFKDASDYDYSYGEIYVSKSDFTLSLAKNNADNDPALWGAGIDDPRVWVSWSKSFDL